MVTKLDDAIKALSTHVIQQYDSKSPALDLAKKIMHAVASDSQLADFFKLNKKDDTNTSLDIDAYKKNIVPELVKKVLEAIDFEQVSQNERTFIQIFLEDNSENQLFGSAVNFIIHADPGLQDQVMLIKKFIKSIIPTSLTQKLDITYRLSDNKIAVPILPQQRTVTLVNSSFETLDTIFLTMLHHMRNKN